MFSEARGPAVGIMTPEMQDESIELKDRLLDAISQVDQLLCDGEVVVHHDDQVDVDDPDPDDDLLEDPDDDDLDLDEEDALEDEVVANADGAQKRTPRAIEYDLPSLRSSRVAFKGE